MIPLSPWCVCRKVIRSCKSQLRLGELHRPCSSAASWETWPRWGQARLLSLHCRPLDHCRLFDSATKHAMDAWAACAPLAQLPGLRWLEVLSQWPMTCMVQWACSQGHGQRPPQLQRCMTIRPGLRAPAQHGNQKWPWHPEKAPAGGAPVESGPCWAPSLSSPPRHCHHRPRPAAAP